MLKGRPLINEYLRKSLPKAQPFILPCRFLDYTSDTLENQIVAFAVRLATNATSLLTSDRLQILKKLRACAKLLTGVSINRITTREIKNVKYNRLNADFQPIHKLCEMIIGNFSLSLQAGERIPFLSLAVDMARLFEDYVALCFQNAFPQNFIGNKTKLRFSLNSFGKEIILDGLLNFPDNKAVVECKYKVIENTEDSNADEDTFNVQGGKIRGVDIYQTTAYASHEKIRATVGILVYPFSSEEDSSAIQISSAIKSLGWFNSGGTGISIYLVGLNLSSNFSALISDLRRQVENVVTKKK